MPKSKNGNKVIANTNHVDLEATIKILSQVNLDGASSVGVGFVTAQSFKDYFDFVCSLKTPDEVRTGLYYGFQPLYDSLIKGGLNDAQRQNALTALEAITKVSRDYLTGYYFGEPNVKSAIEQVKGLKNNFTELKSAEYHKKFRNIDYNHIYPRDILLFFTKILQHFIAGDYAPPKFILGCACGSSEIVLPLSKILDTNEGFVRRSYRRGDDQPRLVREHEKYLRDNIKDKSVLCVEDYVCSGESLRQVMLKAKEFGAKDVHGSSINNSHEADVLNLKESKRKFNYFSFY